MKNLPIGIQSFEKLRSEGFLYVDKTKEIHQLTSSNIVFLSRPRRFGKSLLISTLGELYKGNKALFEGLYIYDKWDWTQQYPVIRIDWTNIEHGSREEIERSMLGYLKQLANFHQLTFISEYASDCFSELITLLHHQTGQKVVVLIDEYDSPILDTMNQPEADGVRKFLQNFYKRLKATDDHLKFIFLTGVTKVAKVSIFSVLNSPSDITMNDKYASICGYTQEELEQDFSEHIDDTAVHVGMTREDLLAKIRKMYDGYTWNGKTSVYNPFSTLMFFENQEFSNYWFETGTPTFLINRLKKHGLAKTVLEPVIVDSSAFDSYDPDALDDVPLLFQTGYLTVKNKEMVNGVPYTLQPEDASEARYHIIFQVWMTLLGFNIQSERLTDHGRIDAVIQQDGLAIVAELKYHATTKPDTLLDQAIVQIREKCYYEPFLDKKVILLGLAFGGKEGLNIKLRC